MVSIALEEGIAAAGNPPIGAVEPASCALLALQRMDARAKKKNRTRDGMHTCLTTRSLPNWDPARERSFRCSYSPEVVFPLVRNL